MEYLIDYTILYALIDEEVSKVADESYSENGLSLYDSIVLTDKDADAVRRYVDDAVDAFVARTFDIAKFTESDTLGRTAIYFFVPDFDETMESAAGTEITRYIVYSACVSIFQSRRAQVVPEYTARTDAALSKAITLLKSRKSPAEIW